MERLQALGESPISFEDFVALVSDELMMVKRSFNRELVIPEGRDDCGIKEIGGGFERQRVQGAGTNGVD